MFFLLVFSLQLLVIAAAFLARRTAMRRERARSMLSPENAPVKGFLPGLRAALRRRGEPRQAHARGIVFVAVTCVSAFVFTRNLFLAFSIWPASVVLRRLRERHRRGKARTRKEEQVLEFIDSLRQSLRSGLSLRQSLEISLEDVGEELGDEVAEILKDVRMGGGLEESLAMAAERSASPSPRLAFTVLGLIHGKGGDLPRILERLRKRVAEGLEVRREARILTSQSRASGYLVSSLPAVFLLVQAALNPRSLRPLFATPAGNLIIAVAIALNAAAFFLIRRMVDPEV
jgi:tight adherence protein B